MRPQAIQEYRAGGRVIGQLFAGSDRFVILVDRGNEWCVASYQDGASEWDAGTYLDNYPRALEVFAERCGHETIRWECQG